MGKAKRYSLPIVLGVVALALLVVAILAVTIWKPQQEVVAEGTSDQPFTMTRAGVLPLYADEVEVRAVAQEPDQLVWLALGNAEDVNAWLQGESYDEVVGLSDLQTLKMLPREAAVEIPQSGTESGVTEDAQSGAEEEVEVTEEGFINPISSDMWDAVKYGRESVSVTLAGDEMDLSLLAATDGVGPSPTLILKWDNPQDNLIAIIAFSAAGVMFLLALVVALALGRKKPAGVTAVVGGPLGDDSARESDSSSHFDKTRAATVVPDVGGPVHDAPASEVTVPEATGEDEDSRIAALTTPDQQPVAVDRVLRRALPAAAIIEGSEDELADSDIDEVEKESWSWGEAEDTPARGLSVEKTDETPIQQEEKTAEVVAEAETAAAAEAPSEPAPFETVEETPEVAPATSPGQSPVAADVFAQRDPSSSAREETVTTESGMMNLAALQGGGAFPTRRALREAAARGVNSLVVNGKQFTTSTKSTESESSNPADVLRQRSLGGSSWNQVLDETRSQDSDEGPSERTE